jgi:hypothetical protein
MENKPPSLAKVRCVGREIFDDIQKTNVHQHINNRPPTVPVRSLMNAVISVAKLFSKACIL